MSSQKEQKNERYDLLHKEYLTLTTRVEKLELMISKLMKSDRDIGDKKKCEEKDEKDEKVTNNKEEHNKEEYDDKEEEEKERLKQIEGNKKQLKKMNKTKSRLSRE
jgi:hypothetical protein